MIRSLLLVLLGIIAVAGSTLLWGQIDRPVRVVRVEGVLSDAEQDAIREVLKGALPAGMLSIDLETVTARMLDLAWPREVRIRRQWPDGLLVQVEREPLVASWGDDAFLTSAGKVVRLPGHEEEALPALSASLSTPHRTMQTYLLLQEQLRPNGLIIAGLHENTLGEWQITLENGITVALGNQDLSQRLQRFLPLYHRVLAERVPEPAFVDTRYENGLALREGVSATPGAGQTTPMLALDAHGKPQLTEPGTHHGF